MSGEFTRVLRRYVERVYRDKAVFEGMLPKNYVRLTSVMSEEAPYVELLSGDRHYFDVNELIKLYNMLPWYLRGFAVLPLVFAYTRMGDTYVYKLLNSDAWSPYIVGYLVTGSVGRKMDTLKPGEFAKLLSQFRTLIIVILNIEITSGGGGEGEGYRDYEA